MDKEELKNRTKKYGIDVIRFLNTLQKGNVTYVLSNQLVRSATSIGANYRAALRARSDKEFIAKIGVIVEEADESIYWLEVIKETLLINTVKTEIDGLIKEANELTAIFVSTLKSVKSKIAEQELVNHKS